MLSPVEGIFTFTFRNTILQKEEKTMKKVTRITLIVLALITVISLVACDSNVEQTGVWEEAFYLSDQTFGKGEKTIKLEVIAEEQSITFTVKTDKETLADALTEHNLIEGTEGPFGLYIKKVNGITADYDTDGYYWSITKDGVLSSVGADGITVENGDRYELTRAK